MIGIFSNTYHDDSRDIAIAMGVVRAFCFVDVDADLSKIGARLCWERNKARQAAKYKEKS